MIWRNGTRPKAVLDAIPPSCGPPPPACLHSQQPVSGVYRALRPAVESQAETITHARPTLFAVLLCAMTMHCRENRSPLEEPLNRSNGIGTENPAQAGPFNLHPF